MMKNSGRLSVKNGRNKISFMAMMAVALCFALIGGTVGMFLTQGAAAEAEAGQTTGYASVYSADNPIPEIAEKVRPAVVQVINSAEQWDRQTNKTSTVEQGYGSGVYVDSRGYILTNYHVIQSADTVEVLTMDGERMEAEVVGFDDGTDVAVLKVDPGKLNAEPVPMGDSDALKVGELAIAIGNPGAGREVLYGTVTAGIISALDRNSVSANNFSRSVDTIQTDAAINSGNSGGALLNSKGELIGIPTLKYAYSYSDIYEGLGFAVPVNTAKEVMEQIIEHGKVIRPRLGVSVTDNYGPEEPLKNYSPAGVRVVDVEEGSPADKAGVKRNDIITEINGERVMNYTEMTAVIDKLQAGDTVKLKIYRYYDENTGEQLPKTEELELDVALEILDA